jgi:hypothetical protein
MLLEMVTVIKHPLSFENFLILAKNLNISVICGLNFATL